MHLLFDIGGTNLRVAVSKGKTLGQTLTAKTPGDFAQGINLLTELIGKLTAGEKPEQICCGIAGSFNAEKSALFRSPNLSGWENQPLKQTLEQLYGCPAVLENDAALAALGEANFGAGKNYTIVVYYTISTGVGGARVVDGKIDANTYGFSPGHQIIQSIENKNFTLEDLIGGRQLEIKYKTSPDMLPPEIWQEIEKNLAVGLYNSIKHWSPEIIILGGGIGNSEKLSIKAVTSHLQKLTSNKFLTVSILKQAALGDLAGLYGAMALLKIHPVK